MTNLKWVLLAVLVAALGLMILQELPGREPTSEATTADLQAYWFGRYAFVTTVMLSGLGPQLTPTPQMIEKMAPAAGLDPKKASMSGMTMVAGVYAGGDPRLPRLPDPRDMSTMRWDPAKMDRTLTPAAQGYTLLKITAKRFHLDYHESPMERFAAVMMIPQAKAMIKLLAKMVTQEGTFVPLGPDGRPRPDEATAQDQIAALWGLSSFFLAATDPGSDYFAKAYRRFVGMGGMMNASQGRNPPQGAMMPGMVMSLPVDDVDALDLMNRAFQAVHGLLNASLTPAEQALALEALGWFAVASEVSQNALNRTLRALALQDVQALADRLVKAEKPTPADRALAVYGLMEAARITGTALYKQEAAEAFAELEALWDPQAGVYATAEGSERYVYTYTPFTVGAVLAGLNAVRLFGSSEQARLAEQRFETFFEHAVVTSGLMRATGYPMMVPPHYREREPLEHFTHPALKTPKETGTAPVYAREVVYEDGHWTVTDEHFDAAQAMFLANMSVLPHGKQTDGFMPLERLAPGK